MHGGGGVHGRVCVRGGEWHAWQVGEHVWQGGMHGSEHVWQGACMAEGHAWQGHAWQEEGMHGGGMHDTHTPQQIQ